MFNVQIKTAQQSVQLTCGILRVLQAFFPASGFFCSQALSTPAHTQLTPTVGCYAVDRAKHEFPKNESRHNYVHRFFIFLLTKSKIGA